ncbi:NfeD family protein [Staphylococcus ureilyticus]|uniref:Serine protease n=1 Tax=Staphylococcus ureilyticus TaxID=94138 RepID=A0AB34AHF5_STAUR|nr:MULTISPECIES: NfeD family protein [Staphylococcus]AVL78120.1 serine protease [Staphylococcus cohnii]MBL0377201.1 serine protease [Staphylococcus sp. S75]MBL0383691.1 serine protease [Staphylococcus sp. S59]MBL0400131.1 serine protease [Staphylococcus sp. S36]MBM9446398.1 serine protease [Staphylococcus ureilyticus]
MIPSISNIHTIFSTRLVENGNWIDNVSNFIVSPIGALILTCIIFLGFLYQLYSNRINIIGIISTLALFIFFLGFFIKGDVNFYSVVLFAIGVIFVIIELFVVGAIIGIIGMALIVFSIVTLGDNLVYMIANVVVALILSIIEWVILVKFFKRKIPFLDKVVLKDSTNAEAGYTSHEDRSHLVGEVAVTSTDLRPAGIIIYNDERIDAVSDGSFILRNKKVTILEVEGTRVVVREIET